MKRVRIPFANHIEDGPVLVVLNVPAFYLENDDYYTYAFEPDTIERLEELIAHLKSAPIPSDGVVILQFPDQNSIQA